MPASKKAASPTDEPLRFAHPFFTPVAPATRAPAPGTAIKRMVDHIKGFLEPIPPVRKNSVMLLDDVIGAAGTAAVEASGRLVFHAVGDTGKGTHTEQEVVSDAMARAYDAHAPEKSPALLFHLGDVIYFNNTELGYYEQFYTPYKHYPGKIIAIPGNHDGEVLKGPGGQKKSLEAFQANFCRAKADVPPAAHDIYREMVPQPGVYWMLDTAFAWIIALYSNSAENPGFISEKTIGTKQKIWLEQRLADVKAARAGGMRKGLLFATHHPPFSSGGHSGSGEMLLDIDDSCRKVGVFPDLFLSAHAHNYQRHMRTVQTPSGKKEIPYLVAGGGGRGLTSVQPATNQRDGDRVFVHSHHGFGFLTVTATTKNLTVDYSSVPSPGTTPDHDSVSVPV